MNSSSKLRSGSKDLFSSAWNNGVNTNGIPLTSIGANRLTLVVWSLLQSVAVSGRQYKLPSTSGFSISVSSGLLYDCTKVTLRPPQLPSRQGLLLTIAKFQQLSSGRKVRHFLLKTLSESLITTFNILTTPLVQFCLSESHCKNYKQN